MYVKRINSIILGNDISVFEIYNLVMRLKCAILTEFRYWDTVYQYYQPWLIHSSVPSDLVSLGNPYECAIKVDLRCGV